VHKITIPQQQQQHRPAIMSPHPPAISPALLALLTCTHAQVHVQQITWPSLHVVRTLRASAHPTWLYAGLMNSVGPLSQSILMDYVKKSERGRWNSITTITR
jgi:hypothetical protein